MCLRSSFFLVAAVVVSASGCSSATKPVAVESQADSAALCPRRAPAAQERAAISCVKHIGTQSLNIGAQYSTDQGPISGFIYKSSCYSGDVYLENYPMSATVEKNDDEECVVSFRRAASLDQVSDKTSKKKKKIGEDAVAFQVTVKSGATIELSREKEKTGRFPAEVKVSVDLDQGRLRVVEETMGCDVLFDLIQSLGCRIKKK